MDNEKHTYYGWILIILCFVLFLFQSLFIGMRYGYFYQNLQCNIRHIVFTKDPQKIQFHIDNLYNFTQKHQLEGGSTHLLWKTKYTDIQPMVSIVNQTYELAHKNFSIDSISQIKNMYNNINIPVGIEVYPYQYLVLLSNIFIFMIGFFGIVIDVHNLKNWEDVINLLKLGKSYVHL